MEFGNLVVGRRAAPKGRAGPARSEAERGPTRPMGLAAPAQTVHVQV